ncbi:MAG: hypothetical protein IKH77_06640 [Clostridia bacterium]|nr:hypothetical protein [Clostridia bacterium]
MKKLLALVLCALLAVSLLAIVSAEDLPEAFAHLTFDGEDEGYKAVTNAEEIPAEMDGANKGIVPVEDYSFRYGEGPVGKALFLDGKVAVDLGLKATGTDAYTVAFWMNASRLSTYGPTLQMGYNVGKSDAANNVTWLNITQSEWGANNAKIFPVVWSRNKANDTWPWMYAWDDAIHGKREWVHVAIVTDGTEPAYVDGSAPQVNVKYYINGELKYDSAANGLAWANGALAPNIMKPDEGVPFEAYFGVNYWDSMYKGYVDDLYIFDSAITDEQVAALYALGNPAIESPQNGPEEAAADAAAPVEEPAPAPAEIAITGTAVGATTLDTPFWGAHSDIWAVPAGESAAVAFVNYNPGEEAANWNNFDVVLQNTPTGHAAADVEGYAEYAVVRADNYGWGAGYDGNEALQTANNYDWNTFTADLNGAQVVVIVTNNGDNADVMALIATADGKGLYQTYSGIKVDGDLYFCLVVDNCCLDIQGTLSSEEIKGLLAE